MTFRKCSRCFLCEKLHNPSKPSPLQRTEGWRFAGDVWQAGTKGDGRRQTSELNIFSSQMLSLYRCIITSNTLYFFMTYTQTHLFPFFFPSMQQCDTFCFIFQYFFHVTLLYVHTHRAPAVARSTPETLTSASLLSIPLHELGHRFPDGETSRGAPTPARLHLRSHLHRKHQIVNRLAKSPDGMLWLWLEPRLPDAAVMRVESPEDVQQISILAGFQSPKSPNTFWKNPAQCRPNFA